MDCRSRNVSQIKSELSDLAKAIRLKQEKLKKWEKSLAVQRAAKTPQKRQSTSSDSEEPKELEPTKSNSCSVSFPIKPNQTKKATLKQPPTLDKHRKETPVDTENKVSPVRHDRKTPKQAIDKNSSSAKNIRRRSASLPGFHTNLSDAKKQLNLSDSSLDGSDSDISCDDVEKRRSSSPAHRPSDEVQAATVTPLWTVTSPVEEAVEAVYFWTDNDISILVICQKSQVTIWKTTTNEYDWSIFRTHNFNINTSNWHKYDVVDMKDKLGIVYAVKFNTTIRLSLFCCYPSYRSNEKITNVADDTRQILGCRCGDNWLVYAFVGDHSTAIDIWRFDSELSRLIRGRDVVTIRHPIHSLCPVSNSNGLLFVGTAPVNIFVWNAMSGTLLVKVHLDETFLSIRSCSFVKLEKSFLFLGVISVTETPSAQLVVINPNTAKWKTVLVWEEGEDDLQICGSPVESLISVISSRCIRLRHLFTGSLKAKVTSSDVAITAHHSSFKGGNAYSLTVGTSTGDVSMYQLCVSFI